MAERRVTSEYSTPPKRFKLDPSVDENSSVSTEALASGDSGFSDFPASTSADEPGRSQNPSASTQHDESMDKQETDDEVSSTVSDVSELSGLSELSGQDWKPTIAGPLSWVQRQMQMGVDPRDVLAKLGIASLTKHIPGTWLADDTTMWKLIVDVLSEPRREKLQHVNTITDVVNLLRSARNIIVLTGAGVSVSCGIPDFRSRDGIYSRLAIDFPDLPDPQAMFDINYFRQDPRPFYKFAREIYPGQFKPSPCHRFLKGLERHRKLLRNYTQNIDTLEQVAGIENVIECHGSFATASCTRCKAKVSADVIRHDILEQRIPKCSKCWQFSPVASKETCANEVENFKDLFNQGIMKPDIVFFGEGLPEAFHQAMANDKDDCDLLIVIGSSLKVQPVALIPSSIPAKVPQILINRERLPHLNFDVELLGDSDVIVNQLCHLLSDEWGNECWQDMLTEVTELTPKDCQLEIAGPARDRHLSIESMQSTSDSGIAVGECDGRDSRQLSTESMQSATMEATATSPSECSASRHMSVDSAAGSPPQDDLDELRTRWQAKARESLALRLPENSYYFQSPNRYIFPGAEVFYEPEDDDCCCSTSESDANHSEEDNGYWEEEGVAPQVVAERQPACEQVERDHAVIDVVPHEHVA